MLFYILKEKGNLKKALKMYKASKKIKQLDLFDEDFYLKKYPNIKNAKISPLNHYLYHGFKENKQPGKLFDNNYYLKKYKDVKNSGENPLVHYVLHGRKEGREINNKNNKLNKKLNSLQKDIKKKNKKINKIQKDLIVKTETIESYNKLFNYLFVFNTLERRGALKNMQDTCTELLVFVDKICKKHKINYWITAGNLLGYARHDGYIPWDDDMDIAMMREDYDKFLSIINDEIKNNNLDNNIEITQFRINSNNIVVGFIQLFYKIDINSNGILAGLDVFPHDYIEIDNCNSVSEVKKEITPTFVEVCENFVTNVYENKLDKETLYGEYFEKLHTTQSKEKYVLSGLDGYFRKKAIVYRTEDIFPLKKVNFNSIETFAPNNITQYLKDHFGEDYMKIPQNVRFHDCRLYYLIDTYPDLDNIYKENIEKLRLINSKENKNDFTC